MNKEELNKLILRLREGIVLKASMMGGIGGVKIDHDLTATKQLMKDAADKLSELKNEILPKY